MEKEYIFYVYIVTNFRRTAFYIGVTNNIIRRVIEHKYELGSNFTKKYKLKYLVYFEEYQYINDAIAREKELKGWTRKKKIDLIKNINPRLNDLGNELFRESEITAEDIKEYIKEIKNNYFNNLSF